MENIQEYLKNKELIRDIKIGSNIVFLANKYNIDFSIIKELKKNIKRDDGTIKKELINCLKNKDLDLYQIAERMNTSYNTIIALAKKFKLKIKNKADSNNGMVLKRNKLKRKKTIVLSKESKNNDKNEVIDLRDRQIKNKSTCSLIENIKIDVINNMSYVDVLAKYKLNESELQYLKSKYGLINLCKFYKEKRKQEFNKMYSEGKTAKEIIDSEFNKGLGKYGLVTSKTLYNIVDVYKHIDHISKDSKTFNEIKTIFNTLSGIGSTNKFIVNYLNEKGYKTPFNKQFTENNINHLIKQIKKINEI